MNDLAARLLMPLGMTSWRSTIAEAPAIRKMSAAFALQLLQVAGDRRGANDARRSPASGLPSDHQRLPVVPTALSKPCRACRQRGLHQAAFIALKGAMEINGWLPEWATSTARCTAARARHRE